MSAILPFLKIDRSALLAKHFTPYQSLWIQADDFIHAQGKQAFAIAEKSARIGWTFGDGFKNVRKRLHHKKRDYLFVTKDWPSSLEYMLQTFGFIEFFNLTRSVLSRGEEYVSVPLLDPDGKPTSLTEQVKIGYIRFDNGSRIIAFSSNPYAMSVYGGDVGIDEFAKHSNAKLLWQIAQARITWNYDMAVWSSHEGEDTLFNQFIQEARAASRSDAPRSDVPWNLYFRVTMPDAIELGLLDIINRVKGSHFTPEQFLADCRARAGSEEIFQQTYMCNPLGASTASIVDWSSIERCRHDYEIERVHLESDQLLKMFGPFSPGSEHSRHSQIHDFLRQSFPSLLSHSGHASRITHHGSSPSSPDTRHSSLRHRLGFDIAASGHGDLAVFYIDEPIGPILWLRALLTARTEDWDFLKTVLFFFMQNLRSIRAAGDETGLGRQLCWEAANEFGSRFAKVNFASKKHDLAFSLMNQLSVAEKRFPRSEADIAADYFALRKFYNGTRWVFTEGRNNLNAASHCDIAWAGALASHAHIACQGSVGAAIILEDGTILTGEELVAREKARKKLTPEQALLLSNDPSIWKPLKY